MVGKGLTTEPREVYLLYYILEQLKESVWMKKKRFSSSEEGYGEETTPVGSISTFLVFLGLL